MTSLHYTGCVSPDGGQQGRQNRYDEIDDRLPHLLLIIVHNSIELICLLIKTTEQILIDHRFHRFTRFKANGYHEFYYSFLRYIAKGCAAFECYPSSYIPVFRHLRSVSLRNPCNIELNYSNYRTCNLCNPCNLWSDKIIRLIRIIRCVFSQASLNSVSTSTHPSHSLIKSRKKLIPFRSLRDGFGKDSISLTRCSRFALNRVISCSGVRWLSL